MASWKHPFSSIFFPAFCSGTSPPASAVITRGYGVILPDSLVKFFVCNIVFTHSMSHFLFVFDRFYRFYHHFPSIPHDFPAIFQPKWRPWMVRGLPLPSSFSPSFSPLVRWCSSLNLHWVTSDVSVVQSFIQFGDVPMFLVFFFLNHHFQHWKPGTGHWLSPRYGSPVKGQVLGGRWKPLHYLYRLGSAVGKKVWYLRWSKDIFRHSSHFFIILGYLGSESDTFNPPLLTISCIFRTFLYLYILQKLALSIVGHDWSTLTCNGDCPMKVGI